MSHTYEVARFQHSCWLLYLFKWNAWSNLVQDIQFREFMGGSLCKLPLGLIEFSPIPGMKPLSCSSQFILCQQKAINNNFQEKELSHKCSTLVFVRLFVAATATVYQEPHFWTTESQELFVFDQKKFAFESIATHDLPSKIFNFWNLWVDLT